MPRIPEWLRRARAGTAPVAAVLLVGFALLAGCGSTPSGSSTGPSGAEQAECVKNVNQRVEAASQPMKMVLPRTATNAASLRGQTIAAVSVSALPTPAAITHGVVRAGQTAGARVLAYTGDGSVNSWTSNVKLAASQGAKYIVLVSVPLTAVAGTFSALGPDVRYVDIVDVPDANTPLPAGNFAHITPSEDQQGQYAAIGILADTGCKANVLAVTYPELPENKVSTQAGVAEIHRLCPSCEVNELDLPTDQSTSVTSQQIKTELIKHPKTNYVFMANDGLALAQTATLKARGIAEAAINCDPPNLPVVARHDVEKVDVCQPPAQYMGFAAVDQLVRASSGGQRETYNLPLRLVAANTQLDPGNEYPGFGDYAAAFTKLWGL